MRSEIKIAFIEQDSGIGGAEVNLFHLFKGLNKDLFRPVVLVPYTGPLTERLRETGVKYHVIPRVKFMSTSTYITGRKIFNPFAVFYDFIVFIPAVLRLKEYLKRERINIVHTNSMLAHMYGGIAAKLAGVPCIWHMQDIVDPRMALGFAAKAVNLLGSVLPERIVSVSNAVGRMFQGKSVPKVRIIYNGTDTEEFSPEIKGSGIRHEFGIAEDELVVGMVGRLKEWKGQKEFLRAAASIARCFPNTKFLIVGDTTFGRKDYRNELIHLSEELGISSKVIFTGNRKDVPEVIRAMDAIVHASLGPEPFGLVIIEGMASGVPVIASNRGAPVEIIEHGKDGFLVNPEDTEELADTITGLLRDKSLRDKIAGAARRKVVERFSIKKFVSGFQKIYIESLS
jgi:glycosyltransferase involved in cell wall biosynthesis